MNTYCKKKISKLYANKNIICYTVVGRPLESFSLALNGALVEPGFNNGVSEIVALPTNRFRPIFSWSLTVTSIKSSGPRALPERSNSKTFKKI